MIDRRDVERDLAALSQIERRTLKSFGVRLGAHSVWLPALLRGRGPAVAQAFVAGEPFRPGGAALTALPEPAPSPRLLSAFGLRAVGRVAAGVEMLESLAERRACNKGMLTETDLAELGITLEQAKTLAGALKSVRAQQPDRPTQGARPGKDSPFAALSVLTAPVASRRKRTRRRKPA